MITFSYKKRMILLICLLLMVCITNGCNNRVKSSNASYNKVNSFLEKNHASIYVNNGNISNNFKILDSDINKNDIILTGEEHAIKGNYELKLSLLKYLNQKYNIRYLLDEIGYSSSCFINQYLESGDETKLKLVFNNLDGTAYYNKDNYNFWIKLRKYNISVPESKRIKVIGIDVEHQMNTACEYLNYLLSASTPPQKIQSSIDRYKNASKIYNLAEFTKAINNLQNDIKVNSNTYSEYLGNNYFDFNMIVDNIVNSINACASNRANFDEIRESSIYSNFKRIYLHLPVEKYFGQFGMEHVYQRTCSSYMKNKTRFAMYLNCNDSPVRGKVLSIAYGYENCFFMNCQNNYFESKCDSIIKDIGTIDKYSKTYITIFKLDGDNSPFNRTALFVEVPNGGCTTDYFQYIILIKNAKGTRPY